MSWPFKVRSASDRRRCHAWSEGEFGGCYRNAHGRLADAEHPAAQTRTGDFAETQIVGHTGAES
jgi:hypothetical protein